MRYDTLENVVIFLSVLCIFFFWLYYKQRRLSRMAESAAYFLGQINLGIPHVTAAKLATMFTGADPQMVKEFLYVMEPICRQWAAAYAQARKEVIQEFEQTLIKEGFKFKEDGTLE